MGVAYMSSPIPKPINICKSLYFDVAAEVNKPIPKEIPAIKKTKYGKSNSVECNFRS
jgi:hypothetical protein